MKPTRPTEATGNDGMTLQPLPTPGQHIDGIGEIFAARKADPTMPDDSHLHFIVYKADGQYHAANYNRCNGLHNVASYADCGDAFTDYSSRKHVIEVQNTGEGTIGWVV